MDDAKFLLSVLLISVGVFASSARTAELEYIGPAEQQALEKDFAGASLPDAATLKRDWRCDMFGVRSHLQVQRDLKLYRWSPATSGWHNGGAQLVSEYHPTHDALIGTRDRFEDQVKQTAQGQLISRLSVNSIVVAYARCNKL